MTRTKRLLRWTAAAAVCAALGAAGALTPTARAGDDGGDAQERFQKAYEAEVVDGKLADAARVYLSLEDDATAPARVRAEAKFRFAVTAVLLGRADEARAKLGELIADAATPETLRARAKEYLDAVRGVGVGTEVDRKLQEMVFELGRAKGDENPPAVYRDFEILGKQAVPALRKLLDHPDAALRGHAYRLLVRMDEPGMGGLWTWESGRWTTWTDVCRYVGRHPDERAAFEARLLALDDEKLAATLREANAEWRASTEFLRTARTRGVSAESLVGTARSAARADPEAAALLTSWACDADDALVRAAAVPVLEAAASGPTPDAADAERLVGSVVRACRATSAGWMSDLRPGHAAKGLAALADACPVPFVLDQIEACVHGAGETGASLDSGIAALLSTSVERRPPAGDDLLRYGTLVVEWAEDAANRISRGVSADTGRLRGHVVWVFANLPRDARIAAARRLFGGPDAEVRGKVWADTLPTATADDFAVAMAAYDVAPTKVRLAILQCQGLGGGTPPWLGADAGRASAVLAALPGLVRDSVKRTPHEWVPVASFVLLAAKVPPEEARAALLATARAVAEFDDPAWRNAGTQSLLVGGPSREVVGAHWASVVLPAAEDLWPLLETNGRWFLLDRAVWLLATPGAEPDRAKLADLVAAHADALTPNAGQSLLRVADALPPERWVPRAGAATVKAACGNAPGSAGPVTADVLAHLAPTAADATAGVREFARHAPPEARTAFFDRLYREAPAEIVVAASSEYRSEEDASPGAVADAAIRLAAGNGPLPRHALARLVGSATRAAPSERLFPAVRRLLASPDRSDVLAGAAAAQSLGRADLLPDLADKLDSMDVEVRSAAKDAIDAIVALRALRDEARKRAAEAASEGK